MKNESTSQQTGNIRRFHIFLFLVIAFVFLYLRTFLLPATPLVAYGDEVHYFLHAVRMLHGQLPYRDFFTFVLPGTDLLYAGTFRLLGVHQWVAQGYVVIIGLLLTGVITWLSSSILRGPLVMLPGLLFLVFDIDSALDATHHWWSTLFVMVAAGILLAGRSNRRIAAAGGLCGVAALFTQTQGALGLLAIALYLAWTGGEDNRSSRFREQFLLLSIFAIVVASFAGYFAYRVGFRTLTYWTVYFPIVYFPKLEAHTPRAYFLQMPVPHKLSDLLFAIPYIFIHLVVPFIYLFCMFRLVREKKNMERRLWEKVLLINLIGLALFATVVTAATPLRICVVAPPAMIACVWFFSRTARLDRWVRATLWTAGITLVLYLPLSRQRHGATYLDLPTGRAAFMDPKRYDVMRWSAEHTRPGESFFNNPWATFALSLDTPSPLDYVTPAEFTRPEQVDAVVRSLADHHTQLIFLYPELYGPRRPGDNLEPFRRYVYKNYHLAMAYPSGQIWERN